MFSIGAACAFMTAGIHAAHVRRRDGTVQWFVLAILTTLLGVALQRGRFPNIPHFNHNDAFHVTQMVALYFYYRCARSVRDRPVGSALRM
jgi:uncharacterized protein DUF6962